MSNITRTNYNLVDVARAFSKAAHGAVGQKRKYTGEPYHVHPEHVLNILEYYTDPQIPVRCATLLHDVLEDTQVTYDLLVDVFGEVIADLVLQVTDVSKPEDGNRATRKALDRAHLARSNYFGASIKLADLISNSQSINRHDPKFAKVYMREKRDLLEVLGHGNPYLLEAAKVIVDNYFAENPEV